jgi:hypothetical protein
VFPVQCQQPHSVHTVSPIHYHTSKKSLKKFDLPVTPAALGIELRAVVTVGKEGPIAELGVVIEEEGALEKRSIFPTMLG